MLSLLNKAKEWRMKRKTLMIVADIKTGKMLVSYKGKTSTGSFQNNTLRNMVKRVKFEKSVEEFLIAQAKLINQVLRK